MRHTPPSSSHISVHSFQSSAPPSLSNVHAFRGTIIPPYISVNRSISTLLSPAARRRWGILYLLVTCDILCTIALRRRCLINNSFRPAPSTARVCGSARIPPGRSGREAPGFPGSCGPPAAPLGDDQCRGILLILFLLISSAGRTRTGRDAPLFLLCGNLRSAWRRGSRRLSGFSGLLPCDVFFFFSVPVSGKPCLNNQCSSFSPVLFVMSNASICLISSLFSSSVRG